MRWRRTETASTPRCRVYASVSVEPAARVEPLGGHVAGCVGGEPDHRLGHLLRGGAAAKRNARRALRAKALEIAAPLEAAERLLGAQLERRIHHPGRDAVHTNTMLRERNRSRARERIDCSFRRRIG